MAHFYGTLNGSAKTQATRMGTKKSGITTHAASWQGAVRSELWHNEDEERDWCRVELVPWRGVGCRHTLYVGPVMRIADPASDKLAR